MSTTCLTIHDLLRITYTYEAQALQAQARKRSDSACFTPETCSHLSPPPSPSPGFATLETDFTHRYSRHTTS
ncbi:hypothetical protein HBI56_073940 [Parastagonospora nodorum]|uniref:Uncharacterized protein n=2 Tax=Phaeosphaeria nodorum (strain SN15 / ATCC MYA-4574 / FGSC 10173) TaxID=321614 RepID=A0A7U2EWL9_PHANO|nr:hypothetical protein SNOG_07731 [Parastagonospora nodorum SN15]KAH3908708.1 hypothetical protein HBH56_171040 [Parastagonospora nodorum]EAT85197.1 hypothetical protein SNOG_07731 [Parastagonospora nodorum SN15]KAH3928449.1 hypothetical protein HBH54_139600 [Parastagonospora nodorum]KAH3945465.1 hypothetical protein HBH53_144950 [Parastagonospora nodorum]KAH3983891.1 hypothetical protein HBH52_059270 [Parastagonospora nodorum]